MSTVPLLSQQLDEMQTENMQGECPPLQTIRCYIHVMHGWIILCLTTEGTDTSYLSVLAWSQQQKCTLCSVPKTITKMFQTTAPLCNIYEWSINSIRNLRSYTTKIHCSDCSFISFRLSKPHKTLRVHIFDRRRWTFFLSGKVNSWIHTVTFETDYFNYYILKAQCLSNKEKPLASW
jgi:hypothetical protein